MSAVLLLSAFLSTASANAETAFRFEIPKQVLTLGVEHTSEKYDGLSHTVAHSGKISPKETQQKLRRGQTLYRIGTAGAVAGLITAGTGTMLVIVGIIPAISGGEAEVLLIGVVTTAAGVGIFTGSSVLMMVGGGLARLALQEAGIPYSLVPGKIVLYSTGVFVGGFVALMVGQGELGGALTNLGSIGFLGGSIAGMVNVRHSFREYEAQQSEVAATWSLSPLVSQDIRGAALTVCF